MTFHDINAGKKKSFPRGGRNSLIFIYNIESCVHYVFGHFCFEFVSLWLEDVMPVQSHVEVETAEYVLPVYPVDGTIGFIREASKLTKCVLGCFFH